MVQIESVTAGKKRKAAGMGDTDVDPKPKPIERCFGIVTDAQSWMFLEHIRSRDGIIKFTIQEVYLLCRTARENRRVC